MKALAWRFIQILPIFCPKMTFSHVAGAGVIPLRIAPEKMLVFSESLPYTSLEIGLKTIFHLWP